MKSIYGSSYFKMLSSMMAWLGYHDAGIKPFDGSFRPPMARYVSSKPAENLVSERIMDIESVEKLPITNNIDDHIVEGKPNVESQLPERNIVTVSAQ